MNNPYRDLLHSKPKVTIRKALVWIANADEPVTGRDIVDRFDISPTYASVILLKLYRWGYLRRAKGELPPRVYSYVPSRFGTKAAKRWGKK